MKEPESRKETAPEELEEQQADELPAREAMSVVEPPVGPVAAAAGLTVLNESSTVVDTTEPADADEGEASEEG